MSAIYRYTYLFTFLDVVGHTCWCGSWRQIQHIRQIHDPNFRRTLWRRLSSSSILTSSTPPICSGECVLSVTRGRHRRPVRGPTSACSHSLCCSLPILHTATSRDPYSPTAPSSALQWHSLTRYQTFFILNWIFFIFKSYFPYRWFPKISIDFELVMHS